MLVGSNRGLLQIQGATPTFSTTIRSARARAVAERVPLAVVCAPMPRPLGQRKLDWILLGFFFVNLTFITYIVDLEQLVIADPHHFDYPPWPPRVLVDLVHWWGDTYDPLQNARPPWWRATIWIDVLLFGPFYTFALYAYAKGKAWIRLPSLLWAAVMMTNVSIIMFEE